MTRCDYSDLPADQCSHCTRPAEPTGRVTPTTHRVADTEAVYGSRCPVCDEWITEGDRIALTSDGWVCRGCAS